MRSLFMFMVIALVTAPPVSARTHHRAEKPVAAPVAEKPTATPVAEKSANVPEQDRDPEDIALDRKIKGICRGC
jgi:hypothetical protein